MKKATYTTYCDACHKVLIPELQQPGKRFERIAADTPDGSARLDFCDVTCRNRWHDTHCRVEAAS